MDVRAVVGIVSAVIATNAMAGAPSADVFFLVNGAPTVQESVGGITLGNGDISYLSDWADVGGEWTVSCNLLVDATANPQVSMSGSVTFQNLSNSDMTFEWGIDVALSPSVIGASLIGGSGTLTLTTVDAGSVTCFNGVPLLRALANDVVVGTMYPCPIALGSSGSGNATSTANFGAGTPAPAGLNEITSIGQREQFTVTPGDKVKFQFSFTYKDTTLGDADGDTKADILLHSASTNKVKAWFMDGLTRTSQATTSADPGAGWVAQGTGDFNADGKADILWRQPDGQLRVWLMNGATVATDSLVVGGSALAATDVVAGIGDIDGDGKADIIVHKTTNGNVKAWFMSGATRTSASTIGTALGLEALGLGDINGDRKADLLFRDPVTNVVSGWLLNGASIGSQGTIALGELMGSTWACAAIGDLDGDGKSDLVWRKSTTGQVKVWLMNGLSAASSPIAETLGTSWTLHGAADLNADGTSDLLWSQSSSGKVKGWLMNGATITQNANIAVGPIGATMITP
ncbi:MAG: VCBS repeat-containing protein [Phycisphaerales bacterium]